ncbi:MAG: DUF459 domain-containing protein [Pseudolabrys sp.]
MSGKIRFSRWLIGAAVLAAAECAGVAAIEISFVDSAQAQFFRDDRYRPRPRGGGLFDSLFGPSYPRNVESEPDQGPVDNSRAPGPRKPDPKVEQVAPTTSIVVMGDAMADWLAYGLEDAFADAPEIAIIRKSKIFSGLLRYEAKGDLDWWHVARDLLAQEKPSYVIMMLGVTDRQNIREQDVAKEADKKEADKKKEAEKKKIKDQADGDKNAQNKDAADKDAGEPEQPSIISPEPAKRSANGIIEFRSDQWAQVYSRRIDETIAALKSKGVPVFWVGLPSIRGTRSTADAVYLNDLYRARAEKAGAVYIDVWDGFVDEAGKYTNNGPDYEGQMRRLRSYDGVFFTKYGARKLAHYVEREIRRFMSNRSLQVSLPSGPSGPLPADAKSAVRPLVGPVVPLTVTPGNSEELLGGSGANAARSDAIATQVLVKGEPVAAAPGRADDFVWRGEGASPAAAATPVVTPVNAPAAEKPPEQKPGNAAKPGQNSPSKPKQAEEAKPRAQQQGAPQQNGRGPPQQQPPRPPSPLGWLR